MLVEQSMVMFLCAPLILLMFLWFLLQILLSGLQLDRDNNVVLLDQELASMRPGRVFLSQINDDVPRSISSMQQLVGRLQRPRSRPLDPQQFHSLVLSMVRTALQALGPSQEEQQEQLQEERQAWAGVLLQLGNVTVYELRGRHLLTA